MGSIPITRSIYATGLRMHEHASSRVLGWREVLALPDLGITAIRGKIDTGARSSALHVEHIVLEWRDGVEWVRFDLGSKTSTMQRWSEAKVLDRRQVTDSGGHRTERVFICTRLALAGDIWPIEINLAKRSGMSFPMLLGRTAMAGRFLVDPQRSFVLGEPDADQTRDPLA